MDNQQDPASQVIPPVHHCLAPRCNFLGTLEQLVRHEIHTHHIDRFYCFKCPLILRNVSRSDFHGLERHLNSQHYKIKNYVCLKEECGATYFERANVYRCKHRQPPPQAVPHGQLAEFPSAETIVEQSEERKKEVLGLLREYHAKLLGIHPASLVDVIAGYPEWENNLQSATVQDETGVQLQFEGGEGHPTIGVDAAMQSGAAASQAALTIPSASNPTFSISAPPQIPSPYFSQPGLSASSDSQSLPGPIGLGTWHGSLPTALENPAAATQNGGELGSIYWSSPEELPMVGWDIWAGTTYASADDLLQFGENSSAGGEEHTV